MRRLLCTALFALFVMFFYSCNNYKYRNIELYPIKENGLYGFVDTLGNKIIVPQYLSVSYFNYHLAAAVVDTFYEYRADSTLHNYGLEFAQDVAKDLYIIIKYGYINVENEFVIAPTLLRQYKVNNTKMNSSDLQDLTNQFVFIEGLAAYQDSVTYMFGFIDTLGYQCIPAKYYDYKNFSSKKAAVQIFRCNEGEQASEFCFKWGYIDQRGNILTDFIYTQLTSLESGRSIGQLWSNAKEREPITSENDELEIVDPDSVIDSTITMPMQYRISVLLDKNGKIINNKLPATYRYYEFSTDGLAVAEREHPDFLGADFQFVDKNGDFVKPREVHSSNPYYIGPIPDNFHFESVTYMSDGFAGVMRSDGKWLFIDKNLNLYAPINNTPYDDIQPFCNGLAAVRQNGKWGYVDKDFNIVIPFKYSSASFAGKHLMRVTQEDESSHLIIESLINRRDSIVWQRVDNRS